MNGVNAWVTRKGTWSLLWAEVPMPEVTANQNVCAMNVLFAVNICSLKEKVKYRV